jgi:hypothetical protein
MDDLVAGLHFAQATLSHKNGEREESYPSPISFKISAVC